MQFRRRSAAPAPAAGLAAILRLAPVIVYVLDAEGIVTLAEGRELGALGVSKAEVVGMSALELYAGYPDVLDDIRAALAGAALSTRRCIGERWFETRYAPLYADDGSLAGTIGVGTDVTESERAQRELASDMRSRRLAEEQLARSEADFRALIECSADAIAVQTEGRISCVNSALIGYLGYSSPSELLGRPLTDLLESGELRAFMKSLSLVLTSGKPAKVMEHSLRRLDGTEVIAQVAIARVSFAGQPSALITLRDVMEPRRMQAQLRAADRMATVGTLTASIAHEINNPLAALLANLELLEDHAHIGEVVTSAEREVLGDAREAAQRVRHIVRDLRDFTHFHDEKRVPLDVSRVIDSALKLAVNELKNRATVVRDYRIISLVDANEVRLGQVFLNLIVNAAHAFSEPSLEKNRICVSTRNVGSEVIVEITDNGSGIPPSIIDRIFEPLFTTKPIGVGTGLGLSICRGIVSALGGRISVESELGRGTTFKIALPASSARETAPRSVWPTYTRLESRQILVIDDEPMIRRIFRRALEEQHQVTIVSSALEALDRLSHGESFDVIFCDLMMPEMGGMEFHQKLCTLSPKLADRVVFMSGGVSSPEGRTFLDRYSDRILQKPFDLRQIETMLHTYAVRANSGDREP